MTKQRFPCDSRSKKIGSGPRHVARTDDIGEAKGDPVDAAKLDVVLAGGLGDRVARIDRIDRMIERDRRLQRLGAVAQRGLKIDQPADLVGLAGLGDIGAADGIDQRVGLPVVRILVGSGGVDHDIGLEVANQADRQSQRRRSYLDELDRRMRREIVAPAGREIVDRQHLVAARQQQVDRRSSRPGPHRR